MRVPRIYTEQALGPNTAIRLEAGPSQHIARALRMQVGDALVLFDGSGGQYPASISAVDKKAVVATTAGFDEIERESALAIHLGIAISRGDRMDWVIQKATELGVSRISPLLSERTEVKLKGDRADKKALHWRQVAISACEQCGRNRLPATGPLQSLDSWVGGVRAQLKLVLHPTADPVAGPAVAPDSIALLVGPEGGLSAVEVAAAERAGFHALQLGPRVLRTETAPLAAIAVLQARWGDMSGPYPGPDSAPVPGAD